MNNANSLDVGGFGFIALFLLILFVLFRRDDHSHNYGFSSAEKQGLIDSARTQYLVEQQSSETRSFLGTKIDYYKYEELRDKISKAESENMFLKGQIADDHRYNTLRAELSDIRCNMLDKPKLFSRAYTCDGTEIPAAATAVGA